jgi:hypothetical protein
MEYKEFSQKGCCGKTVEMFRIDGTMTPELLAAIAFKIPGLKQNPKYTISNQLFASNNNITLFGSFGANMFQVRNNGRITEYEASLQLLRSAISSL